MINIIYLLVGMIIGLLIGYFRVFGIIERYFRYHSNMSKQQANEHLIWVLQRYKHINKKYYKSN